MRCFLIGQNTRIVQIITIWAFDCRITKKIEAILESNFGRITCFQYGNYFLAKYLYIINILAFPMSINDMQFVTTKLTSECYYAKNMQVYLQAEP